MQCCWLAPDGTKCFCDDWADNRFPGSVCLQLIVWSVCRLLLLMGGFLLFFIAFFTVHAIFKVRADPTIVFLQVTVIISAHPHTSLQASAGHRPTCSLGI